MNQAEKAYSVKPSILVVEDDYTLREAMVDTLDQAGFDCMDARNGQEALALMEQFGFKLVLSDLQMPQMDGLALVTEILAKKPDMPIIIMTAYGSVEKAVQAIKLGATDFINKPFDCDELVKKIQQHTQPLETGSTDNTSTTVADAHWDLAPRSPKMQKAYTLAKRVARTEATVLISGPSGTGKEVMSRFIHEHSMRVSGPFVAINCAAIPENMLEAILFGHEKGAFTGALAAMPGKFEQANGGTLLLDEVTEMPLGLQAKLLRVLQEKEVERLGGKKVIALDVRVLATSNRDLNAAVERGAFREDLFYRLNVFPVKLPALCERKEDIEPLVKFLLNKHGNGRQFSISEEAMARLQSHDWPGNIRELENVVQRAIVLADDDVLTPSSLLIEQVGTNGVGNTKSLLGVSSESSAQGDVDWSVSASESVSSTDSPMRETSSEKVLEENLRQQEHKIIIDVLRQTGGRRKVAAEKLGISARTLRYKLARLKSMGIDVDDLLEA